MIRDVIKCKNLLYSFPIVFDHQHAITNHPETSALVKLEPSILYLPPYWSEVESLVSSVHQTYKRLCAINGNSALQNLFGNIHYKSV